jgi:hypothetical protein
LGARVDASRQSELVNGISAKILAAQGRGGDSEIAHVTPGELVLHPGQLSPATRAMILADLAARGVAPDARIVSPHAVSNPQTATPQFASANTARTWKTDPPKHVPNHVFSYDRNGNFIRDHFIPGTSLPPQSPDFAAKGVHQPPFRPDPGTYVLDLGPTKQDTMRFDAIENSPRAIAGNSSAIQDPAETLPTPFCSADKRIAAQPLIREFGDLQVALYWARRRNEQLAAGLEDKDYSPSDNMILMNERTIQNTQIKLLEKRMDGLIEKLRATLPGCEKDLQRDV